MTVTDNYEPNYYVGNGAVSTYSFTFPVQAQTELLVVSTNLVDSDTELAIGNDYTVSLSGDGTGSITLLAGNLTTGHKLVIARKAPLSQPTDFTTRSTVAPATNQTTIDAVMLKMQQLQEEVKRCIKIPISEDQIETFTELPSADSRADRSFGFDSDGRPTSVSPLDTAVPTTVWSRAFLASTTSDEAALVIGSPVVDTIAQMKALDTSFVNGHVIVLGYYTKGDGGGGVFHWDSLSVQTSDGVRAFASNAGGTGRFIRLFEGAMSGEHLTLAQCGCKGDNTTDDATQFANGVNYLFDVGGGRLVGSPGKTYKLTTAPTVKTGVQIDLCRSTVNLAFANGSDVVGFELRDYSAICNGTINVVELGPPTSSSKDLHCAVVVGRTGGNLAGYKNWRIADLTITTNRDGPIGGRGVLVQSASHDGIIENINFPSGAYLGSGVEIHWAGPGGNPPATSEHPYNITVRNIYFGTMTKAGASFDVAAIDLVGCYNVTVENVHAESWSGDAFVQVRTGGFGDTVAPAAIKPLLFRNNIVRNVTCKSVTQSCVLVNGKSNDAVGTPLNSVPCILQNIKGVGTGGSSTYSGIRILNAYDVLIDNCEMEQFQRGLYVEEASRRVKVFGGRYFKNQQSGVYIIHGTTPQDTHCIGVTSYLNGQAGSGYAGFEADNATRTIFENCTAGDETSETTQSYGFRVTSSCVGTRFLGVNRVRNFKAGGAKYLFSSAVYGQYTLMGGTNAALSSAANEYGPISGVGKSSAEVDSSSLSPSVPILLTNFQAKLSTAPTAGKSYTVRVIDDGGTTPLEIAIADSATTGSDFDVAEIAANSELSVQTLPSGTPAASRAKWSAEVLLI